MSVSKSLHLLGILILFRFSVCECNKDQCERDVDFEGNIKCCDSESSHCKPDTDNQNLWAKLDGKLKAVDIKRNIKTSDCSTPEGMMRLIPNSKYFVRKDLGPVPDPKAPPNYRPVKEYCESLNLKLPTIQHHADFVSLQEYILTLAHTHPEQIWIKTFGWRYTRRMVFLDVKFNKSTELFESQQNPNASMYIIWDWTFDSSIRYKPIHAGTDDTRLMVNAIRFYQKWNKTDDENDDKNKYWMAVSSGNQRVKIKFHPLVLCQFPEGSECHLKSHEERQNQIEIKAAEGSPKDLDILGWINGHLFAVFRNPISRKEATKNKICEKEGMVPFQFDFFWNTILIGHAALNGTDQKYLRPFRDYYVCRNLKNRIMPLAPFWVFEKDPEYADLINVFSISLSDYDPDEDVRGKYSFSVPKQFGPPNWMIGAYAFCHCAENNCTISYPKDKNACST